VTGTLLRGPGSGAPTPPGTPARLDARLDSRLDANTARVLDFRRRTDPPRRKRRNPFVALLKPLATALLLVALPGALTAWVLTAPQFQLREVVVAGGTERVPTDWVLRELAPIEGRNLVRLPLTGLAERLRRNPWVETVELRKELPGVLRVAVTERRPVALLESGGKLFYADTAGRPIVPVAPEEETRVGLLEVQFSHPTSRQAAGGVESALAVAAELGRVRPDWAAGLTRIEVLGEEDFRLHTRGLRFPLLVTSGQVGPKVRRLEKLLPELESRYPAIGAVDLRFSRRIVVQPAVAAPAAVGAQGSDLKFTG
jgi:cell division septal protein FtsQ